KIQLFFTTPRTDTCKAGAGKHGFAELVQKIATEQNFLQSREATIATTRGNNCNHVREQLQPREGTAHDTPIYYVSNDKQENTLCNQEVQPPYSRNPTAPHTKRRNCNQ
ncbi:MAG: hypothetical protein IKI83_03975, partial [Prevotella sp.]|nr:hypothetical protein [Prevotella sp.]